MSFPFTTLKALQSHPDFPISLCCSCLNNLFFSRSPFSTFFWCPHPKHAKKKIKGDRREKITWAVIRKHCKIFPFTVIAIFLYGVQYDWWCQLVHLMDEATLIYVQYVRVCSSTIHFIYCKIYFLTETFEREDSHSKMLNCTYSTYL